MADMSTTEYQRSKEITKVAARVTKALELNRKLIDALKSGGSVTGPSGDLPMADIDYAAIINGQ